MEVDQENPSFSSDLRYDLSLTLEEAYTGKKKILNFQLLRNVTFVTEVVLNLDMILGLVLSMCGGHGQVRSSQGFFTVQQTCPQCSGSGEEVTNPCKRL